MATYSAEVSTIGLGVGLPSQQFSAYKSAEFGALALSLGLVSATLKQTRIASFSTLALSPTLQPVTLRKRGGVATVSALALSAGLPQQVLRLLGAGEYPDIQAPSQITFTPPKFPLTKSKTQQGTTTTRIWASSPGDAALSLEYEVIDDTSTERVLDAWDGARGNLLPVDLPASTFGGASSGLLTAFSLTNQRLQWYFTERPQVRSIFGGFSSLSVSLKGVTERVSPVNVGGGTAEVQPLALTVALAPFVVSPITTAQFGSLSLSVGLQPVQLKPFRSAQFAALNLSLATQESILRISNGIATVQPLALSLDLQGINLVYQPVEQDTLFLDDVFLDSVFLW